MQKICERIIQHYMKMEVWEKFLSLRTKNTVPIWANEIDGCHHNMCFGAVFRLQFILKINGN
jgi:hypothetical protein